MKKLIKIRFPNSTLSSASYTYATCFDHKIGDRVLVETENRGLVVVEVCQTDNVTWKEGLEIKWIYGAVIGEANLRMNKEFHKEQDDIKSAEEGLLKAAKLLEETKKKYGVC